MDYNRLSFLATNVLLLVLVMAQAIQDASAKPFDSGGQDELEEDISQTNLKDYIPHVYDMEDLVIADDWKPSPEVVSGRLQKRVPDGVPEEPKPYQYVPDAQNSRIRQRLLNLRNQYGDKRMMAFGPYAYRKRQILYRQCFFNPISCF